MAKRILTTILSLLMVLTMIPIDSITAAADIEIRSFSVSMKAGASKVSGNNYVWQATNNNRDHRYTFRINYALSGTHEFEPDKVEIRIPKSILRDRTGSLSDYYDMSIPEENDEDITEGTKYVYKVVGDEIVIYNRIPVPAGETGYIEVSYLTNKKTYEYKDYNASGSLSDNFNAKISIEQDSVTKSSTSESYKVGMNTKAEISYTEKRYPTLSKSWNTSWGEAVKPQDDGLYYYLIWPVKTVITDTSQAYDFSLTDVFDNIDGSIVGYKMQGESAYRSTSLVESLKTDYEYGRWDYVLTKHKKSTYESLEEYQMKNNVIATVHPKDGIDPDTSANSRQTWLYKKPVYTKPTGHFMLYKYGNDYRDYRVHDSEDIRDFTLDDLKDGKKNSIDNIRYYVEQIGYSWPWTLRQGDDWQEPSNYGKESVRYEITDKDFYINSESSDESKKLGNNDYNITKLKLSYYALDAEFSAENQSFITKKANITDDRVNIYISNGSTNQTQVAIWNPDMMSFASINNTYVSSASEDTIIFKDNVKGYKLIYSNSHYMSNLTAYPYISLLDSENVMNEIADKDKISITNKATATVKDYRNTEIVSFNKTGTDYIIGVDKAGHLKKGVVSTSNSRGKKLYTIKWGAEAYEDYMLQQGGNVQRVNTIQESGKFYDLLPKGGEYVDDSIQVYLNRIEISDTNYEVEVKKNYKGSGRDLLIVSINELGEIYRITYDTSHSWDAVKDYGTYTRNDIAYETGNEDIGDGYPDNGGSSGVKEFNNLDPSTTSEKFLYTRKTHEIDIITAANLGLNKKVKAGVSEDYVTKGVVDRDSNYSYRVRFATTDITEAKDLIIFDSLENYTVKEQGKDDKNSTWRGTLESVDVSQIRALGAEPIVYYSNTANLNFEDHHDLSENIWVKSENFGDISNAKAIAVDMRYKKNGSEFILPKDTAVTMTINMRSPDSVTKNSERRYETYNNIYLNNTIIADTGDTSTTFIHQDYTTVSYVPTGDLRFYKVNSKDHDEKIQGITFRLSGESEAGDDVDMRGTSDRNGLVSIKRIPVGEYALQEIEGNDDWLMDYTERKVIVADDGEVTIEGLTKENGYYFIENDERIHGDLEFRKKSVGTNDKVIDVVQSILSLGVSNDLGLNSSDYVTIDGKNYFVLAIEDNNKALLVATGKGPHPSLNITNFQWKDSSQREYLNSEWLNSNPTISSMVLKTKIKSARYGNNIDETEDFVFIPSLGDFMYSKNDSTIPDNMVLNYYKYGSSIQAILRSEDVDRKGYGIGISSYYGSTQRNTINAAGEYYLIPMFWVDLTVNPQVNVPGTTFKLEGKSDYGTDVLEYGTSTSAGKVNFKNLEMGTYKLTETKNNPDYILETTEYTVIVDATGNVSIKEAKVAKNGEQYLENEPYHNFSLRKVDAQSGAWLEGGEFTLKGTSDRGTKVDMTEVSNAQGRVTFDMLESGTYVLEETKCPDKYLLDTTKRIVTIDKYGNTTIEGITEKDDQDFFKYPNERAQDGKIKVIKKWKDNLTGTEAENRELPEVTISSKEPEVKQGITVTKKWVGDKPSDRPDDIKVHLVRDGIDKVSKEGAWHDARNNTWTYYFEYYPEDGEELYVWEENVDGYQMDTSQSNPKKVNGKSVTITNSKPTQSYAEFDSSTGVLRFFRDEFDLYTNGQEEGTKKYYTGMETEIPEDADRPWMNECYDVTKVVFEDPVKPLSVNYWFMDMANLEEIEGLENLDTSDITSMQAMFMYCDGLTSLDVSSLDTSKVEDMDSMFFGCNELRSVKMSGLDTSKVTNMYSIFGMCDNLETVDIASCDTSNVTNFGRMFYLCYNLGSVDLSHMNTSSIINCEEMFSGCYKVNTTLNIMAPVVSNRANFMCKDAARDSGLLTLRYISPATSANIDTLVATKGSGNVVNGGEGTILLQNSMNINTMSSLSLTPKLGAPLLNSSSSPKPVTEGKAYAVFDSADGSLTFFRDDAGKYTDEQVDGTKTYYTGIETKTGDNATSAPWYNVREQVSDVIFQDRIKPVSTAGWFYGMDLNPIQNFEYLDSSALTRVAGMFAATKIDYVDISHLDTSRVTDFTSFLSIDMTEKDTIIVGLGDLDTSSATNMSQMFSNTNLSKLEGIENINTSNVTDMSYMFSNTKADEEFDFSFLDTSEATDMSSMFSGTKLSKIVINNWDTSKVQNMVTMFYRCTSLTYLDISSFTTESLTNMNYMFDKGGRNTLKYLDIRNIANAHLPANKRASLFQWGIPDTVVVGDNTIIRYGTYQRPFTRRALLSGKRVYDQERVLFNDNVTVPAGYYVDSDLDIPEYLDLYDIHVTSDDETKWVKESDDTWTYTFDVFDDEAKYFAWESIIPDGYTTDTDQNHYQVINDGNGNVKQVIITNTSEEVDEETKSTHGDLKIKKYVEGNPSEEDRERSFAFTITLSGMEGTKVIQDIIFKDGVGTVHLKDGEEFTLKNLPSGTTYEVKEEKLDNTWEVTSRGSTGEIEADAIKNAVFTNTKKAVERNGFKVEKNVKGSLGDLFKEFTFHIELSNLEVNKEYSYKDSSNTDHTFRSDANGSSSIDLTFKDGSVYTFAGLPVGSSYRVIEDASDHIADYSINDNNNLGEIEQSRARNAVKNLSLSTKNETVDSGEDITVLFTNTREQAPNTGVSNYLIPLVSLLLLLLIQLKRDKKKEG